jgi:hypothetical protein
LLWRSPKGQNSITIAIGVCDTMQPKSCTTWLLPILDTFCIRAISWIKRFLFSLVKLSTQKSIYVCHYMCIYMKNFEPWCIVKPGFQ